ncbi:undecaprenol kinase/diacylglycerol kinase (ATP) [Oceanobacillus limi]|uniref:Undecaprenol kinase/diacylglycerol kinase (ATP) n=1 Tax=Oceanobacillus limi TaxID=930131 RepID=A0A1I0FUM9_9BACI|nr:diacylglycerol kinase family protein [Oceanobacillus limi]SET61282.1 undecaprenol kinase/diacylglycerol kinase (ATP) [Oceanobacillus limi]
MNAKNRRIGFSFAWNGIKEVFLSEFNFRLHTISALFVLLTGFYFRLATLEWAFIILSIGMVLITETMNTAIEKMVDYMKPEIHPTAKVIKDIAAGSVLLATITAGLIGLVIFIPKVIELW